MDNITRVIFNENKHYEFAEKNLCQWDKGQKLQIDGLDVSGNVQVHFSLDDTCGEAPRMPGEVQDGSILVDIPAFILEGDDMCMCENYYSAYAFVYPTEGDVAETIAKVVLRIKTRPKPADYASPTEKDIIQKLQEDIDGKVSSSGHAPDKYLGTDAKGNVVEKDAPEGGTADLSDFGGTVEITSGEPERREQSSPSTRTQKRYICTRRKRLMSFLVMPKPVLKTGEPFVTMSSRRI